VLHTLHTESRDHKQKRIEEMDREVQDAWVCFRVTHELRDSLHQYAADTGRSTSQIMRTVAKAVVREEEEEDDREDLKATR